VIEHAHQAAVKDALAFIENHALFTPTGQQGIRQVNVRGLVGAAFTRWDGTTRTDSRSQRCRTSRRDGQYPALRI
jgi:hypothetical protein